MIEEVTFYNAFSKKQQNSLCPFNKNISQIIFFGGGGTIKRACLRKIENRIKRNRAMFKTHFK